MKSLPRSWPLWAAVLGLAFAWQAARAQQPAAAPDAPAAQAEPSEPSQAPADGTPASADSPAAPAAAPAELDSRPAPTAEQRGTWSALFEGALLDSDNAQDFRETAGYHKLLDLVASYTPEDFESRALTRLGWQEVMRDPNAWRGQFVKVRGVVVDISATRLDRPTQNGILDVYRCVLTEGDGSEGVIFDLTSPPPKINQRMEPVDVEGVLYRTVRYQNRKSGEWKEAPYLIARNVRNVDLSAVPRALGPVDYIGFVLMGAAILFLGYRIVSVVRQQLRHTRGPARNPSFDQMFRERAASSVPPPKPPPLSPPQR